MRKKSLGLGLLLVAVVALIPAGCGDSALAASSTCKEFMAASPEEQAEAISELSSEFETPDLATPLGSPNVSYACSSAPDMTLGEYFERFHEGEG